MYLREAMQQEDQAHFLEAMVKEISDHTNRGHWRITTRDEMRKRGYHHRPIMAVWSFKRKRNPMGDIVEAKPSKGFITMKRFPQWSVGQQFD